MPSVPGIDVSVPFYSHADVCIATPKNHRDFYPEAFRGYSQMARADCRVKPKGIASIAGRTSHGNALRPEMTFRQGNFLMRP